MIDTEVPGREWEPYKLDDDLLALAVDRVGPVARVTLTGPGRGNAMGPDFWRELPLVVRALDDDRSVRAIVVTGAGGTFSFGLDLPAYAEGWARMLSEDGGLARPRTAFHDQIRSMQASLDALAGCRTPVAAAVSGWCIGGGVDLIAACDVRFASTEATFSLREVRVAVVADMGALQRLPGIIGDGHLRELALTGKDVDAAHAQRIGLVNEVSATPAEALERAVRFAEQVAANPPLVVAGIKQVLDAERAGRVEAGLRYTAAWNAAFMPSQDLAEAMAAFVQRRRPDFTGR